jgi:hypothetical protein
MTRVMNALTSTLPRVSNHNVFTASRSVMMGASLYYMIETEKWWHAPLILLVPSVYTGYQSFQNRDAIRTWVTATLPAPNNHIYLHPTNQRLAPSEAEIASCRKSESVVRAVFPQSKNE